MNCNYQIRELKTKKSRHKTGPKILTSEVVCCQELLKVQKFQHGCEFFFSEKLKIL